VVYLIVFMLAPTMFEMGLVCTVLQHQVGFQFVATALVSVGAYFVWTYAVTEYRAKYRNAYNDLQNKSGAMIIDSLINFETVKYFQNEQHEEKRLGAVLDDYNHYSVRLAQSMGALNFGQGLIFTAAAVVSVYLSAHGVMAGTMTVGDLVLVDSLLIQLSQPLSFLGIIYREFTTSALDMQAMFGMMRNTPTVTDRDPDLPAYKHHTGEIEFREVSFGYNPDRQILNKVSFTVRGGTTVAVVGPSGCGKSTILRLLYRFYNTTHGTILMDGQPLQDIAIDSVRSHIGVIPQDNVLFNDTIAYNIGYGRIGSAQEEIEAAAKGARIHDAITTQFPQKYETQVGERGLKLSGGEKQRVAIARVLLKNAPILLADEATSALDTNTETSVMQTLKDTLRDRRRTVLLIAHRLSTVMDADKIIVLGTDGSVAEQGCHEELLAAKGLYYAMWNQQKSVAARGIAAGINVDAATAAALRAESEEVV
jgi:ABC-type transport system involved in Fe-S cluster assembly fused permease/ATPase subunit